MIDSTPTENSKITTEECVEWLNRQITISSHTHHNSTLLAIRAHLLAGQQCAKALHIVERYAAEHHNNIPEVDQALANYIAAGGTVG